MEKGGYGFSVTSLAAKPRAPDHAGVRIEDLRQRFRPQREWAEGRGSFLILAHFLTGTGAGTWLFAALSQFDFGLLAGFVLVGLGGIFHLLFLGQPRRFWRMIVRFGSSWISRGLAGMTLFMIVAGLYLWLLFLKTADTAFARIALIFSLAGAAWIVAYKGFVWASSKGIPLWNTPLVPVLYIAYALRAGAAVILLITTSLTPVTSWGYLEPVKLWLAISTAVLVLAYLGIMRRSGVTALRSTDLLLFGGVALPFYLGVILLGLLFPVIIGSLAVFAHIPADLLGLAALFSLAGDLSIIYCIAKAGLYRPLPV
jgi:formate-dependent nitrite reductase membrane component NrfD